MRNSQPVTTGAKLTHYCPAFWALYDALDAQAAAGDIDEYGVSYRLRDHLLGCGECKSVQANRQKMSIVVNGLEESGANLQSGDCGCKAVIYTR